MSAIIQINQPTNFTFSVPNKGHLVSIRYRKKKKNTIKQIKETQQQVSNTAPTHTDYIQFLQNQHSTPTTQAFTSHTSGKPNSNQNIDNFHSKNQIKLIKRINQSSANISGIQDDFRSTMFQNKMLVVNLRLNSLKLKQKQKENQKEGQEQNVKVQFQQKQRQIYSSSSLKTSKNFKNSISSPNQLRNLKKRINTWGNQGKKVLQYNNEGTQSPNLNINYSLNLNLSLINVNGKSQKIVLRNQLSSMNRKNREIKKAKNPRLSIQTFQINQKLTEFLTAVKYPIRKQNVFMQSKDTQNRLYKSQSKINVKSNKFRKTSNSFLH